MSARDRAALLAHDRALADWIEAEALVESLRRSARFAAQRAAERARDASRVASARGVGAYSAGAADAAQVLAQRAVAEERRLEEALRVESLLRGRVVAARAALGVGEGRASCG